MLTLPYVNNPNKHNILREKGRRNLHAFPPLANYASTNKIPLRLLQQQQVTLKQHQKPEYMSLKHAAHCDQL